MPTFSDSQQFAVWRRVFIFEFNKQFSLTPEEGKELCDPYIYDKFLLPEWQSHLVKEIFDAVEVPEPKSFHDLRNAYFTNQNQMSVWLTKHIKKDEGRCLSSEEIVDAFNSN